MALCAFSSDLTMDNFTVIDNLFFSEFLPQAPENALRVYLYGRFLCTNPHEDDNTIESMATVLALSEDEIISCFAYWQEMGLVNIVQKQPVEIKFLPIRQFSGSSKLRQKEKYAEFNRQAQSFITGRQIQPHEYNEYYTLIETYHFEPEAVLMIIKYCTLIKNGNINYPYILTVAHSFERDGIKTATALEEKLLEQERASAEIKAVLSALGIKRDADMEERNLYLKWSNDFGFTQGVILKVAKDQNKVGGFHKLNETLTKYFELKLFSIQEIDAFRVERDALYAIAKDVTRIIGQHYSVLDSVVENYVSNWVQKGYTAETLSFIAKVCFKSNIKTLSSMDEKINKFFKLGLISAEAIEQYLQGVLAVDAKIRSILDALGLLRNVTSSDRELYKIWTEDWAMPYDLLLITADLSKTREHPISYLNKILSDLHTNNITEVEAAKTYLNKSQDAARAPKSNTTATQFEQRAYTKQELNALFDSLDDIEI